MRQSSDNMANCEVYIHGENIVGCSYIGINIVTQFGANSSTNMRDANQGPTYQDLQ